MRETNRRRLSERRRFTLIPLNTCTAKPQRIMGGKKKAPPSASSSSSSYSSASKPKPAAAGQASRRMRNAERSAYFARREAAKVLRFVLQGDARRRAVGSIKSLVYSPSVKNKKATFALVCQTLKHLAIIKEVLDSASVLNSKWKRQEELVYIIAYDVLFGKESSLVGGDAEKFLMRRKDALQKGLAKFLVRNKVKKIDELVYHSPETVRPCYVRVNTLKLDVDSALLELGKQFEVEKDNLVPDLLKLPPDTDLHNHPLVSSGSVFMQGKASSMVAAVLDPKPGWEVLDACSAPGNKTVHLAALMNGRGKVIACELNKDRIKRLEDTIRLSGATNIEALHSDFLSLDPQDRSFSKVCAILLDPSCSGSGTVAQRLDYLLPSHNTEVADTERLKKLAAFQRKALAHALSFPAVKRVVYSTCSIHQIENEDVIQSVLPLAASLGFQLEASFPNWPTRGLPVFDGSEHLLRTDTIKHGEGFFIALFVKKGTNDDSAETLANSNISSSVSVEKYHSERCSSTKRKISAMPVPCTRMSKLLFYKPYSHRKLLCRRNKSLNRK